MPSSPSSRLPLLLKLAAASLAGLAALLSLLRLRRRHLLSSFRLDLLSSLDKTPAKPPSILVTGFRSHGKSSLVNTLCRVLADERGPLVMRSETAPAGPLVGAASSRHVVRADVAGMEEEEEEEGEATAGVEVVDGRGLGKAETATAEVVSADVEAEVAGEEGKGGDVAVDCVVVVVRCAAPAKERRAAVRRLADVASAVRARGRPIAVV